ncbi:prolipoprotein diacylglyceryl transferase [Prochlorococcus sp. MIT 1223]|uniref:prolipoprotein diacylglyceryl transferase n=1 Tax=Prochlorococcus sp. MIT 1223 TaxID=3096217 RepID=UPI002A75E7FC|nr:prolipoprotein diacylglyceryl transferase [Prochlorococcus sp. MIT 1223]
MENVFILAFLKSPGAEILRSGPIALRWYGFLIAVSVIIGLNLSSYLAKRRALEKGLINDLLPILILSSIIGARVYYVIFEWRNYSGLYFWSHINLFGLQVPFPSILEIWGGGIAIHGALIGGFISVILFCKLRLKNFWNVLDVLVPSLALGQSIGRWGNFFNNEAFGTPTSLPWKLFIPINERPLIFSNQEYFHPTFLYESIWNFLIFLTLIYLFQCESKGKLLLPFGTLTFIYLINYSLGRLWIEGLRIDPLCINSIPPFCEGGIRVAQLISLLLIVIGVLGLSWVYKRREEKILHKTNTNQNF